MEGPTAPQPITSDNPPNTNLTRDESPADILEPTIPSIAPDDNNAAINISSSTAETSPNRSSSAPTPSSKTDANSPLVIRTTTATDVNEIGDGEEVNGDGKDERGEAVEEFEWDDLEERFLAKMEECRGVEEGIWQEFRGWVEMFEAWTSTTTEHEVDRAHKRLRTRMAYVQGAEKSLEEKRLHYVNVVKAFESALALLGGP